MAASPTSQWALQMAETLTHSSSYTRCLGTRPRFCFFKAERGQREKRIPGALTSGRNHSFRAVRVCQTHWAVLPGSHSYSTGHAHSALDKWGNDSHIAQDPACALARPSDLVGQFCVSHSPCVLDVLVTNTSNTTLSHVQIAWTFASPLFSSISWPLANSWPVREYQSSAISPQGRTKLKCHLGYRAPCATGLSDLPGVTQLVSGWNGIWTQALFTIPMDGLRF